MKSSLKRLTPNIILDYLQKRKYSSASSPYRNKSTEETFNLIHSQNIWGSHQSVSGQGSTLEQTSNVSSFLNEIIMSLEIGSILDLPCGDFNWMQNVEIGNINYIGGDIVSDLIENNKKQIHPKNIQFQQIDLLKDELPAADLILVRDCFVHFSYADILLAIKNIKRSKCKYLLTTTFTQQKLNGNIITGDWRPINLLRKPFYFPKPILMAKENLVEEYKRDFRGKSLALWKVDDLRH